MNSSGTQDWYVSWAPSLAAIGFSVAGGAVIGGLPGAAVGLTAAVLDEYLIAHTITDKHYISSSTYWYKTTFAPVASFAGMLFPSYKLSLSVVSYVAYPASLLMSYVADDFLDFRNKIEVLLDSFLTVNKLFDKKGVISSKELERIYNKFFEDPCEAMNMVAEDVVEIYNNDFLRTFVVSNVLSSLTIVMNNLFLHFLASYSGSLFVYNLINKHKDIVAAFKDAVANPTIASLFAGPSPLKILLTEGGKIIGIYTVKNGLEFFIDAAQLSLLKDQMEMLSEKSTEIIIENGKRILASEDGREITQNLSSDLFNILFFGVNKLNSVISGSLQSLVYLRNVANVAPDALAPYMLSLLPMQMLLKKMSKDSKDMMEELSKVQSKVWEVKSDIADNIEQINLRDGEEFVKYRYNSLLNNATRLSKESELNTKTVKGVIKVLELFNQFIDVLYFGMKVMTGQLDISQIPLVKISIDQLYGSLSNNINFEIENKDLIFSKERVDKLFKILSTVSNSSANHTTNDEGKVVFKNYSLMLYNRTLVEIGSFEFHPGKHYAITGKSGCGKTSVLTDVKEGVFGALRSTGEISVGFSDTTKIMFIDQKLYLPKGSSLLETIYFPNILQLLSQQKILKLKEKVLSLFRELDIDEFTHDQTSTGLIAALDSKEFKLSGGQMKKVAIIQAILNVPDILIMDETFTSLDRSSLIKVQKALNKYLPGTLVLSVDHHAEGNNYNGFYDFEVHFANGTITELPIASKGFEEAVVEQKQVDMSGECSSNSFPDFFHTSLC